MVREHLPGWEGTVPTLNQNHFKLKTKAPFHNNTGTMMTDGLQEALGWPPATVIVVSTA